MQSKPQPVFSPELKAMLDQHDDINRGQTKRLQARAYNSYVARALSKDEFHKKYNGGDRQRIAARLEQAVMILGGCGVDCSVRNLHSHYQYCETCKKLV